MIGLQGQNEQLTAGERQRLFCALTRPALWLASGTLLKSLVNVVTKTPPFVDGCRLSEGEKRLCLSRQAWFMMRGRLSGALSGPAKASAESHRLERPLTEGGCRIAEPEAEGLR